MDDDGAGRGPMTVLERLAVGFLVGVLGLLVGLWTWWFFSGVPGLDFGWRVYLSLACALGIASFVLGLWRPERTMDALGVAWEKIWNFFWEVLRWFRFLR